MLFKTHNIGDALNIGLSIFKERFSLKVSNKNQQGFTLIEMIVAFAIMSIISGVGVASFLNYSKDQRVRQTAEDVRTTVQRGKFSAISKVKPTGCDVLNSYSFETCAGAGCTFNYRLSANCSAGDIIIVDRKVQTSITPSVTGCTEIRFEAITNNIRCEAGSSTPNSTIILDSYSGSFIRKVVVDASGNALVQ